MHQFLGYEMKFGSGFIAGATLKLIFHDKLFEILAYLWLFIQILPLYLPSSIEAIPPTADATCACAVH